MATRKFHSPPPPVLSPAISDPIETPPIKTVKTPPIETTTSTRQLCTQRSHPRAAKRREVEGAWISPTGNKMGKGASRKDTQKRVGRMLVLFTTLSLPTTPATKKEEVTQLKIALLHDHLVNLHPTTKEECMTIASRGGSSEKCECMLHAMDPPCSSHLQGIMAYVSELDGQLYSRNLTNVGVDVLKYILQEKGGFKNIQIQQEAKSTNAPFSAGSKVAYIMEDEEWKHSC